MEPTPDLDKDDRWTPRAQWSELPTAVQAGIERLLGSRVVEAHNQVGGFSPGMAAIVRCADGSRVFVKAVGRELNSETPTMHRTEGRIAAELPPFAPTPPLLATYDDGDWVALVFEAVDGRMPTTPWLEPELSVVIEAITRLSQALTPCPIADVPTVSDKLHDDLTAYERLAKDPPSDLNGWERRNLDALATLSRDTLAALGGDTLLHLDLRADNIVCANDGQVFFVDWPWACRGAAWIDIVVFLINAAVDGRDPEPYLAANPLLDGVEPGHVTGLLAGVAGMWAEAMRRPPPPGLPTIRAFQRVQHDAVLPWVRRRLT